MLLVCRTREPAPSAGAARPRERARRGRSGVRVARLAPLVVERVAAPCRRPPGAQDAHGREQTREHEQQPSERAGPRPSPAWSAVLLPGLLLGSGAVYVWDSVQKIGQIYGGG
ncbi:hypothetical protein WME94_41935 [Sorangium sp. So ce429]